jgi:hypothetical protein
LYACGSRVKDMQSLTNKIRTVWNEERQPP